MQAILVLLVGAVVVSAAPVPKEHRKTKPDSEFFVGAWDTVEAIASGLPSSKATWTFDENLKMTSVPLGGQGPGSEWPIRIDPKQSPKHIDIGHYKGIYEIDGTDIKIAFTLSDRPASFESTQGLYFNRLRRVGAVKK